MLFYKKIVFFLFQNLFLSFTSGSEFVGGVDFGTGECSEEAATNALVFMVVALNGSFKLPIAHFFTSGVNGQGKHHDA